MVTIRWVMAWLGNGFGCSMKDERMCKTWHVVGVRLWWMMIWCVKSTKECVTTDVPQYLVCPCILHRFQGLYDIVSSHLGYWKVCAQWVPKMLTEEHKNNVLLVLWYFWCAITRKETACWAILWQEARHGVTCNKKQQSLHWKHTGSPKMKKFKQTFSTRKIMCTVLWDRQGVLSVEFLPQGTTKKLCCLLWNAEEAKACNSKQKARNAECHHSFASR